MDLYHILNRGVDKRTIFLDTQDYARFVHNMFEFNDTHPANNTHRSLMVDVGRRPLNRELLVDIHGWCLMGNHYHLLISEKVEGGMVLFLKKLNGGYAKYFNERYTRVGTLFQGRTKKVLIDSDAYLLHILNYIHFNPLDFMQESNEWRSRKLSNSVLALEHLQNYKWSSYKDYIGIKNFPSILNQNLFQEVFNHDYKNQVQRYLSDISTKSLGALTLE